MSDISSYVALIPVHNQWKLDKELDWDNDYGRDTAVIARSLIDWQAKFRVAFQFNNTDVARCNSIGDFDLSK